MFINLSVCRVYTDDLEDGTNKCSPRSGKYIMAALRNVSTGTWEAYLGRSRISTSQKEDSGTESESRVLWPKPKRDGMRQRGDEAGRTRNETPAPMACCNAKPRYDR